MSQVISDLEEQWAGAFSDPLVNSDKVWAAGYTASGFYAATYGKRGSTLQGGKWADQGSLAAAKAKFEKDVREKEHKGYLKCGFNAPGTMIPAFGIPRIASTDAPDGTPGALVTETGSTRAAVYRTAHVMPMDWAEAAEHIQSNAWAWSEKVNGVRCLVAWKDGELSAYNRKGQVNLSPPVGAEILRRLPVDVLLDGEQMDSHRAGQYVAFDLLELGGQDLRSRPFTERMHTLVELFLANQLIPAVAMGPTLELPEDAPGLAVLVPIVGDIVSGAADLRRRGREGVILRDLSGKYTIGDTSVIRKFKFLTEIDCEVLGFKAGSGGGSLILGVTRTSDGAVIPLGRCRCGLNEAAINAIRAEHERGIRPVVSVKYLGARTVGLSLVEAVVDRLRTDKSAAECTTDQFGPEKAAHIVAAIPYSAGRTL